MQFPDYMSQEEVREFEEEWARFSEGEFEQWIEEVEAALEDSTNAALREIFAAEDPEIWHDALERDCDEAYEHEADDDAIGYFDDWDDRYELEEDYI